MKKTQLVSLGIFLSVIASPQVALAATPSAAKTVQVSPSPTPQISGEVLGTQTKKKVDYLLPYPGLLSDNPLYILKQLRDSILERLIVDPTRKAEFHILQSDKFLNMGLFLQDKGKIDLAGASIVQSGKYMDLALASLLALKGNGVAIPGNIVDRLEKSTAKHIEVLDELLTKIDAAKKDIVNTAITQMKSVQGELPKLK